MGGQRENNRAVLAAVAYLGWVAFVIAAYYVVHKPWWDNLNLAPFAALLDIGLAAALVCLAGGLGRRILPELEGAHPLEQVALQAALGLGILAFAVLSFGLVGWLSSWIAWLGLGLGWAFLRKDILGWMRAWGGLKITHGELNRLGKLALGFVLFLFLLNLFRSLAPPLKWDSLVYHLQVPVQYVHAGRIFFYPENLYAGFPQLASMVYTWAIALRSVTTAATLGWAAGVVMFIGLEGFTRRILGNRVAWLAPAVLLSGFSISQAMSWAYVDLWIMFFGLMMLVSLVHYRRTNERSWLILAGVMVGFAMGAKYTAGLCFLWVV